MEKLSDEYLFAVFKTISDTKEKQVGVDQFLNIFTLKFEDEYIEDLFWIFLLHCKNKAVMARDMLRVLSFSRRTLYVKIIESISLHKKMLYEIAYGKN